ncbi:hypothetical protein [Microbulbifer variabilis]|uniref:hypothetical protein n=1 Tax=Microbulbifer variabilis TaxID=266805 RepID=UPI001CFDF70D|nr:hypothetical protein [Microbulbifer variabilis]
MLILSHIGCVVLGVLIEYGASKLGSIKSSNNQYDTATDLEGFSDGLCKGTNTAYP